MARKTTKPRKTKQSPASQPKLSRRDLVRRSAFYGLGAVALAGGGAAFAFDFANKLAEADLTVIGNGAPTLVQIHDPGCALCRSLQKEVRRAFKLCDDTEVQYRVANIQSMDGAEFQARVGLPHVSLVFFDASGARVHIIQGVTPAEQIKADITRIFA